jgi:DNA mismatch repair protein MutL
MSKIHILPEHLANQIAAGEVVERPASVVKELVENSLDANATRIEIEIEGGGTRLIRIIDDGEGMDEDDILLCLERHGTSKIKEGHDLISISTLGFRGEAIPSIGSVSKLSIISRPDSAELGTKVVYEYGKLLKVHETGTSRGTQFEIKNLFGNTPARRKFLRTVRTELGHIEEIIKNYSLGSPQISFVLRVNGRETLHLDANHSLEQRLAHIMNYQGRFIEVGTPFNNRSSMEVHGLLVPPETPLATASKLRFFVNGRAIKDRMMAHAVHEGLRGFLMKGKSAAGYLHIRLPVDQIDVNVHPAKHEVRFRNSREIHEHITKAVITAMEGHQRILQESIFHIPAKDEPPQQGYLPPEEPPSFPPPTSSFSSAPPQHEHQQNVSSPHTNNQWKAKNEIPNYYQNFETREPQFSKPEPPEQEKITLEEKVPPPSLTTHEHGLQIIGQFRDLYIFCQSEHGLVVIDQHAAHERLLYEEFRSHFIEGKVASQTLLFPETVELTLFQIQLVEKHTEEIQRMGFTIKEFGGSSYVISAIPALAGQAPPSELFLDLLETFGSEKEKNTGGDRIDHILSTMACKAAIKSGYSLTETEINALLNRMARANLFSHCPHGRPVVKQFNENDIKKWFFRT